MRALALAFLAAPTFGATPSTANFSWNWEAVSSLDASVTGAGSLTIDEADAITLTDVDTANGSIAITAAGALAAVDVAASGGSVSLTSTGATGSIATTVVSGTGVTLVADACATYTPERHEAALRAYGGYCWISDTDTVVARVNALTA